MIQLEPKHLEIINKILSKFSHQVYAFGSRTKNTSQNSSDLDLCVMNEISTLDLCFLSEAFESSDLPFRVDIVVWNKLSLVFRDKIKADLIKLGA